MAVTNSSETVQLRFEFEDGTVYSTPVRRGQIVHEAFHRALPKELTVGHRLTFRAPAGNEVFADNFVADLQDHFETTTLITTATPIAGRAGNWRNIGFDHLAITVHDRPAARDFFRDVLQLEVARDDAHLTVVATGMSAIMIFDAGMEAPLSPGTPSSWHHLGFVVDDLEAAYAHLQQHKERLSSDFTLLERDERWSLYFFYKNGDVTFMFQLSEIKPDERGFQGTPRAGFENLLYDYANRPYGLQWDETGNLIGRTDPR